MPFMTADIDRLANLRRTICALRAEEAALEAHLTAEAEFRGIDTLDGLGCDLMLERTRHRVFDIAHLPDEVLNDDRFYSTRYATHLRIIDKLADDAVIDHAAPMALAS